MYACVVEGITLCMWVAFESGYYGMNDFIVSICMEIVNMGGLGILQLDITMCRIVRAYIVAICCVLCVF